MMVAGFLTPFMPIRCSVTSESRAVGSHLANTPGEDIVFVCVCVLFQLLDVRMNTCVEMLK